MGSNFRECFHWFVVLCRGTQLLLRVPWLGVVGSGSSAVYVLLSASALSVFLFVTFYRKVGVFGWSGCGITLVPAHTVLTCSHGASPSAPMNDSSRVIGSV